MKGFLISGPCSSSGKTLVSICLMASFKGEGYDLRSFKTGPDYIDPMFHTKVLGVNSRNLDLFFTDKEDLKALYSRDMKDLTIVEGAMGLYDGMEVSSFKASSYEVAQTLSLPVILVVNAKGMSYSLVALLKGFMALDSSHLIKGVILNNISPSFYKCIKSVVEKETHLKVYGYVPPLDINLESRHLGLHLPHEIEDFKSKVLRLTSVIKESVDLKALYEDTELKPLNFNKESILYKDFKPSGDLRLGVAMDEAFCFYYEDNLRLLKAVGFTLIPFSPIRDKALPEDLSGVLLGGGYPELYASDLEKNISMRESLMSAIEEGLPSLAECGGFMYLHNNLVTEDSSYKMVGLVDGDVTYKGHLVRFGYINLKDKEGSFTHSPVKAHEFHYYDSTSNGSSCIASKISGSSWETIHSSYKEGRFWGFPHLYYGSSMEFVYSFYKRCKEYRNER